VRTLQLLTSLTYSTVNLAREATKYGCVLYCFITFHLVTSAVVAITKPVTMASDPVLEQIGEIV